MTGQSHLAVYDVIEIVEFSRGAYGRPPVLLPELYLPGPSRPFHLTAGGTKKCYSSGPNYPAPLLLFRFLSSSVIGRPLFNPFMRFRGPQSTIHSGDFWERYIYSYYILGL